MGNEKRKRKYQVQVQKNELIDNEIFTKKKYNTYKTFKKK